MGVGDDGPDPPYVVRQGGRRRLWDDVAAAYTWWIEAGEPTVGARLCTLTPAGQRVELPSAP